MEELKFDKEMAEALYRIFCGLSSSCYQSAEVCAEAKPNMKKAYEKVLDWGGKNCVDMRGEKLRNDQTIRQTRRSNVRSRDNR